MTPHRLKARVKRAPAHYLLFEHAVEQPEDSVARDVFTFRYLPQLGVTGSSVQPLDFASASAKVSGSDNPGRDRPYSMARATPSLLSASTRMPRFRMSSPPKDFSSRS